MAAPVEALTDDLAGEILLRVAPDEPAHLVRAAAVCKPWRRILADPAFLRRCRAFHRTPPLLGFDSGPIPRFVPDLRSSSSIRAIQLFSSGKKTLRLAAIQQ